MPIWQLLNLPSVVKVNTNLDYCYHQINTTSYEILKFQFWQHFFLLFSFLFSYSFRLWADALFYADNYVLNNYNLSIKYE